MKVLTVVGTRPEIIRLSCIISKLDENLEHKLVHTGQNYDYELNKIFFEQLHIRKPDYFLDAATDKLAHTIGNIISKIDDILEIENPDALLVLGDTNSALSVIPAKRRKIPIFHMEAGNRCYDLRVPEEINRKIVDHTSDINMPYSSIAREYLLKEGFPADQIVKTGSPMYEVLETYKDGIDRSAILNTLGLKEGKYFLFSAHREENVDEKERLMRIAEILDRLCVEYEMPIIFSTHPRTRKRIEAYGIQLPTLVRCEKPFGFLDYIKLQQNAFCVISDSGTITEESSILNFPAINLRDVHERPEGVEEGSVIMTGLDPDRVLLAVNVASQQNRGKNRSVEMVRDYYAPNVSEKVIRTIISYAGFVNTRVWKKNG